MSARDEFAEDLQDVFEGGDCVYDDIASALMLRGYSKPRTITTVEELDALPDGSLIKFPSGVGRTQKHSVSALTGGDVTTDKRFALPATVLYTPKES